MHHVVHTQQILAVSLMAGQWIRHYPQLLVGHSSMRGADVEIYNPNTIG